MCRGPVPSARGGEVALKPAVERALGTLVAIKEIERLKSELIVDLKNRRLESIEEGTIPEDATEVNLRRNLLSSLPVDVMRLVHIRTLHLSCNRFATFPVELCSLVSLECLYMSDNDIVELPSAVGRLRSLKVLRLCRNRITRLPDEIGDLPRLTTLVLGSIYGGNELTSLPATIGNLSCLEELDVSGNRLVELPHEIGRLSSLRVLNASCNALASLPRSVGHMSSLHTLNLRQNCLRVLPEEIGQLRTLAVLDVVDNRLALVPGELRRLTNKVSVLMHGNPLNVSSGEESAQSGDDASVPASAIMDGVSQHLTRLRLGSVAEKLDLSACASPAPPLSLLELAGRAVLRSGVDIDSALIPADVRTFLRLARECDRCGSPYIRSCQKYVGTVNVHGHMRVPSVLTKCSVMCRAAKCETGGLSW